MLYGLTEAELKIIILVLEKFPDIEKAILFGSRAMGRQKRGSEIDIALKGNSLETTVSQVSH